MIVKQVVAKMDSTLAKYVKEAEVYCFDVVGPELVVDGVDPRALVILDMGGAAPDGLDELEGMDGEGLDGKSSDEKQGSDGKSALRKGRIFVYQRGVERAAGSLAAIADELTHALEHGNRHGLRRPAQDRARAAELRRAARRNGRPSRSQVDAVERICLNRL